MLKTHNTASIDINDTSYQDHITATFKELTALFGKHHTGDTYKVEAGWGIQFPDGTVATIYNWKNGKGYCGQLDGIDIHNMTSWHVGGFDIKSVQQIQIALDLHREAEETPDPIRGEFESVADMMTSLRATRGEAYATTIELALMLHKQQSLLQFTVEAFVSTGSLSEKAATSMMETSSLICAKTLSRIATLAGLDTDDQDLAKEVMGWVSQIVDREAQGVAKLVSKLKEAKK